MEDGWGKLRPGQGLAQGSWNRERNVDICGTYIHCIDFASNLKLNLNLNLVEIIANCFKINIYPLSDLTNTLLRQLPSLYSTSAQDRERWEYDRREFN